MAIIYMTPHDTSSRIGDVSGDLPDAGAPEVTAEMIEAGMGVVWKTDLMDPRETELREMVRDVFLAMNSSLPKS